MYCCDAFIIFEFDQMGGMYGNENIQLFNDTDFQRINAVEDLFPDLFRRISRVNVVPTQLSKLYQKVGGV